jgi:hypothetical protein
MAQVLTRYRLCVTRTLNPKLDDAALAVLRVS